MLLVAAVSQGCRWGEQDAAEKPMAPPVTPVPLRVWILSPRVDRQAVERQWKANSDQPIELVQWTPEQVLERTDAPADVLVYPARMLGELVDRGWIVKLPNTIAEGRIAAGNASGQTGDAPQPTVTMSAAERAQATYDGHVYGVSLGCSIPVVIASGALGDQIPATVPGWNALLDALPVADSSGRISIDRQRVDPQALVDRYLALVGGFTTRSSKYGILFEMQTMTSRLREPEFVQAAEALMRLARQPGGLQAVVGTHTEAWQWITSTDVPAVAIVAPTHVDDRSVSCPECRVVTLEGRADFPAGWNTGGGLVAGLAAQCRQTAQSAEFLRWLGDAATRTAVAPLIGGVDPTAPLAGIDSLDWRARKSLAPAYATDAMPREPSLTGAHAYRAALAEQLLRILLGEQTPPQGLEAAHRAWQAITDAAGSEQRDRYEKSLGLIL